MVASCTACITLDGLLAILLFLRLQCTLGLQMPSAARDVDDSDEGPSLSLGRGPLQMMGKDGRCLNFLHIPKTGGTSLEKESNRLRIIANTSEWNLAGWGRFDRRLKCEQEVVLAKQSIQDSGDRAFQFLNKRPGCSMENTMRPAKPIKCSKWHFPPAWDRKLAASYEPGRCTTFCVVRHPIQRAISEAGYALKCSNQKNPDEYMDDILDHYISDPGIADCHMLPQYEFVYGGATVGNGLKLGSHGRYCQRVLRFEHMEEDFMTLMEEFNFPLRMRHENPTQCKVNLKNETIQRLQELYAIDFETFGYKV